MYAKTKKTTSTDVVTVVLTAILMVFVAALISSIFVWWGWNASMPHIFKLPEIDIIQAFGLNLVGSAIFKSYSSK